ncbi:unnamed protein product [Brachionus calyciflorus]|uniref:Nucleoporin Nup43 n=1 Tax=Brachionus calyciflorus TaxID=104777 RepID=A0A813R271_9BILA|nr:unnamed protein product [Brachionus calyciflorus]
MYENLNKPEQIYLNFNASKVRWLSNSKVMPTNLFCIGSGENLQNVSVWKMDQNQVDFEPQLLCESDSLDGMVTEIKAKNSEEIFVSTSNGSVYHFKYSHFDQKLSLITKWSSAESHTENLNFINSFDFNSDCDELCYVTENGTINFIRLHSQTNNVNTLDYNELCSLNSVLYLKQFEIAVGDSLGRVKIWDARSRDNKKSSLTLYLEGESSPIVCMANHPNQQHMVACGNLNGILSIYDVRSNKRPFIMSHNHSEPIMEVCFHPFSSDNLISCSFDGSLWFWNASSKGDLKTNWEDRTVNAKNYLESNRYTLNSFDINNDQLLAVNNNFCLYKLRYQNLF